MLQPGALSRHRWRKQLMYHLVERRNLSGAARLHATAPEETVVLRRIVDPDRVIEIPNGVDVAGIEHARAGARERLGIPARDPVVVFLGRLHPIKRIDLLAAAVARVRKRRPSTHLVIAGPDEGGQLAALQSALAPLGPFVHTPGALDDHQKASLLAEATTLVLCSDTESFGMAVVEAMASALPVVVSRTCGWSGIERDGCGWLVDQRVDDIADAIERVIADPQRAAEMGRRGAQLARERYSWHGVAAQMIACYEDVLAGRAVA
jgi:glycosyltransferase involved in cell wall biosynthesis